MGATGRGEDMEITTYLESALSSELQGNLVDICPVGALTSKPYAFAARPWSLGKTQSIDVMDGIGSAIRVDTRGREVMRILPRVNEAVNEEWISEQDPSHRRRSAHPTARRPYIRENGQLRAASWSEAFGAIASKTGRIAGKRIGAIAGDLAPVEEMFALKELLAKCGSVNLAIQGATASIRRLVAPPTFSSNHRRDRTGRRFADRGLETALGAAVLNARIRKRWRSGQLKIGVIAPRPTLPMGTTISVRGWIRSALSPRASIPSPACLRTRKIRLCWSEPVPPHGTTVPRYWRWRQSSRWTSARSRTAGTVSAFCRIQLRGSARSISALPVAPAA